MIFRMARAVHRYGGRDLSRVDRSWDGLGFSLVRWAVPGGAEGLTRRREHLLFVTLSGRTGHTVAEMEGARRYQGVDFPGATTFIPSMRRRWSRYGGGVIDYAALRLDPGRVAAALGPEAEAAGGADRLEFTGFTNAPDPFVHQLALRLAEEARTAGGAIGRLFADSVATTLALHLVRRYAGRPGRPPDRRGPPALTGAALGRVLTYVHDNLGEDLGLDTLADLAGVDRYHFGRCFKAATGSPPYRYVVERRLERAAELLRRSADPIADIAYQVGFSSQSHLTTAFRRRYGTTPNAFRRATA
jgi:AraC family transcriptional regulator